MSDPIDACTVAEWQLLMRADDRPMQGRPPLFATLRRACEVPVIVGWSREAAQVVVALAAVSSGSPLRLIPLRVIGRA